MYSDLVRHVSCIVCTTYDVHVVMLSFHCRRPTLYKCGPCLSGGEPSGVCYQREVHVLCVRGSVYTRVNFRSSIQHCCCWSVLQDYSTRVTGHVL